MQYFLGFEDYTAKELFYASMMVHFRKHFSNEDIRSINELVVQRCTVILLEALAQATDYDQEGRDSGGGGAQMELDVLIKHSDFGPSV